MRSTEWICVGTAWAIFAVAGTAVAQDRTTTEPLPGNHRAAPAAVADGDAAAGQTGVRAALGRGYLPYSYPGFNSCPCAWDGCFHPHRYYCGGEDYRRTWRQRWLRAHLGLGSMLDGYLCECIYPTAGRLYRLKATTADQLTPEPELPPKPSY